MKKKAKTKAPPPKPVVAYATVRDLEEALDIIIWMQLRTERVIKMKISEGTAKIVALGDQLEKARTEIVSEIEKLKAATTDADLPDAASAAIDRLAAIGQALDDINPDEPVVPADPTTPLANRRPSVR